MAWTQTERGTEKPPYVHQEYPKMVYHATEAPRVVGDEAAWAALGAAWGYVSPVVEPEPEAVAAAPVKRKARG